MSLGTTNQKLINHKLLIICVQNKRSFPIYELEMHVETSYTYALVKS